MKKILLGIFCLVAMSSLSIAQQVIEDFEGDTLIPLNQLSNGTLPNDSLVAVPNPAPDDVDSSDMVLKFRRSSAGDVWAGWWSELPTPVDMTTNKWVSVKVWKPRVSVVKFKVEGGTTNPTFFELASVRPQTKTNEWEEIVFHFPGATGTYPKIAMLVDFNDPVGLTEDIVCYVDDITFLASDPAAPTVVNTTENDDFTVYPNPAQSTLYLENLKDVKSISVYSLTGQKLLTQKKATTNATINVSNLSSGVYMLSVESNSGSTTMKKFVKE
jgi:hypothetical protein